jgi:hypothetical protein
VNECFANKAEWFQGISDTNIMADHEQYIALASCTSNFSNPSGVAGKPVSTKWPSLILGMEIKR